MAIPFRPGVDTFFYQRIPSDMNRVVDLPNISSAVVAEIGDGEAVGT
jgi:hypothetical protein